MMDERLKGIARNKDEFERRFEVDLRPIVDLVHSVNYAAAVLLELSMQRIESSGRADLAYRQLKQDVELMKAEMTRALDWAELS